MQSGHVASAKGVTVNTLPPLSWTSVTVRLVKGLLCENRVAGLTLKPCTKPCAAPKTVHATERFLEEEGDLRFLEPGEGAPGSVGLSAEWTLPRAARHPPRRLARGLRVRHACCGRGGGL